MYKQQQEDARKRQSGPGPDSGMSSLRAAQKRRSDPRAVMEETPPQSNPVRGGKQRFAFFSGFSRPGGSLDDNILRQSALRRSSIVRTTGTASPTSPPSGANRPSSSSSTFPKRNTPSKSPRLTGEAAAAAAQEQDKARATYRRYRVGDSVLVCNTQSRWGSFVNRYGYPPGGGMTSEEQRGPYLYVLSTVKKVHFEEDAEYYTVTRADTGADQRADAGKCVPFPLFIMMQRFSRTTCRMDEANSWSRRSCRA